MKFLIERINSPYFQARMSAILRATVDGPRVAEVEQDQDDGRAEHPMWNAESARRNHPASDGEPIWEEAASIAAPQVLAYALVDVNTRATFTSPERRNENAAS